jgi:hypothetical protein
MLYLLVLRPSIVWNESSKQIARSAIGGALLISGPLIGLLHPGLVSSTSLTLALALTPVVITVAESAAHNAVESLAGRLWPGLAAIAGLLLLLEQPSLANPARDFLLVLSPVLSGCGAVLFASSRPAAWRLPAALLGGAAVLALGAVVNHVTHLGGWPDMPGLAAGLDAVEAILSLVALSRLSAARWSAQFAIVPLLVVLEGIGLARSSVPLRMIVGLVLLAAASAALLMPPSDDVGIGLGASGVEPTSPE